MIKYKVEKDFMIDEYRCVIIGGGLGYRCGYVGLPNTHPLYGMRFNYIMDEFDIDVHGGLTYSRDSENGYPVECDDLWWLGFDCGHYMDGKDFELIKELSTPEIYKITLDIEKQYPINKWQETRTKEYVEEELISLVKQLKELDAKKHN